ncbi:MAG: SDR family oxidoreductase [candidate division Zixibacteria bacterium]|nr:SDR family oxidoreductase [candidate division Zixibacteria bacterium]MDH4032361.1 SDR family oxidoreductase [candidate division Zixibacteria bacterium]
MDLNLNDRRVLVTGASTGLGAAAAQQLALEGATVYINGRDQARLDKAAETIAEATTVKPHTLIGDMSKPDDVERVVAGVGDVDILVCNTGGPPPGQFLDMSAKQWNEAHDLLLGSATHLTRAALPSMIKNEWGRVIYITSVAVLQPIDNLILSNSYRSAVTGLCKTLSNNYAGHGVTFNTVCPGYTATERLSSLADSIAAEQNLSRHDVFQQFADNAPSGRLGQPDELAALITFLASDRAAYITGASIPVDGGLHRGLL